MVWLPSRTAQRYQKSLTVNVYPCTTGNQCVSNMSHLHIHTIKAKRVSQHVGVTAGGWVMQTEKIGVALKVADDG